jgi:hypothetical protein
MPVSGSGESITHGYVEKEWMEINQWERNFRASAKADEYAVLGDHLRRLALPDSPDLLLEGTIRAVQACLTYATLDRPDGKNFIPLLEMQQYDPADSRNTRYAFTFDLGGKAYARLLVEPGFKTLDLADLYGHPWHDYKVVGYNRIWISRTDWKELMKEELQQLEEDVTGDLRFDYSEDEVEFWFDSSLDKTYLAVFVHDVEEEEDMS